MVIAISLPAGLKVKTFYYRGTRDLKRFEGKFKMGTMETGWVKNGQSHLLNGYSS